MLTIHFNLYPHSSCHLSAVILGKLVVPESSVVLLLSNIRNGLNFLGRELEARQLPQVPLKTLFIGTRGDGDDALVHDPAEGDISRADTVLLGQLGIRGVERARRGLGDCAQGAVGRDGNVVLAVELDQVAVLEVRVVLDLVDGGRDAGGLEDDLEVLLQKVGHANGPGLARVLDSLDLAPDLLELLGRVGQVRRVHEVQVHVVELQLLEGQLKGLLHVLLLGAVELGRHVQLLTGRTSILDGETQLLLVAIHL